MKIVVLGNCQSGQLMRCLRTMLPGHSVDSFNAFAPRSHDFSTIIPEYDHILAQPDLPPAVKTIIENSALPVTLYPRLTSVAFHPDFSRVHTDAGVLSSPLGGPSSAIAFFGWKSGFSVKDTLRLYCAEVYREIGFFNLTEASQRVFRAEGKRTGVDLENLSRTWIKRRGSFLHTINHPKLFAIADVARVVCNNAGFSVAVENPEDLIPDSALEGPVWPVYKEIATHLGIEGSYTFKRPGNFKLNSPASALTLDQFVSESYVFFDEAADKNVRCPAAEGKKFAGLPDLARRLLSQTARSAEQTSHPYKGLPNFQFWKSAVAACPPAELDPVVDTRFVLSKDDRIGTAGSCFAQHIARHLSRSGYNYLVTEKPPASIPVEEADRRNFGVFSARYANLYTCRQFRQLLERASGSVSFDLEPWTRRDGRLVDPFRPEIEPDGFSHLDALKTSQTEHLGAVRQLCDQASVFIFTLGLTEGWRSKRNGAVVPLAPGVAGSPTDPSEFEFINFDYVDCLTDLEAALSLLRDINPSIKVILTVSPVSLAATYERRHILLSNTLSKSVLRTVASRVRDNSDFVEYFPSYEIIVNQANRGAYYEDDFRNVRPEGVAHVMRVFSEHFFNGGADATGLEEALEAQRIVCEEELLAV